MTQLIERVKLDNFDDLLPPHFHRIFAECHLNLALGNATTSCVLAGAMLEYGLREKCPEHSTNKTRIKEVEAKGIWSKDDAGIAWEVLGARSKAVHGDAGASTINLACAMVRNSRTLLHKLFAARQEPSR